MFFVKLDFISTIKILKQKTELQIAFFDAVNQQYKTRMQIFLKI